MPTRGPSAALNAALERLRLQGAVFLRAEYREPWAYESLPGPATANLLRPGETRVVLFHVVASGRCWVAVGDGERHWAADGDVIVLPYGDQHRMGGVDDAEVVPLLSFLVPPPWAQMPVLRHGADGTLTGVVCGYLHSSDPLFDPAMRVFPPVFVVRPPAGPAADWVRANITYALAQTGDGLVDATALSTTRLPEMLLVEVLRLHLATAPATERGWVAALRDPVVAPAMALLHGEPERKWTVEELARATAVSRSLLDARFRDVLGRSPIRYLTEWRMHLARDLLSTTDLPVVAVARRVGYDAEEAFSRAFKRHHGTAPGVWRSAHHA
ncbi:AraC family transcriptional regulator [Pseudonocardia sp. N23]|uniref:AraC family transcriptional regulator n=1 Tax=Pseudonocardia sp. N23 TaxID=1987376 RepID=UPI001C0ECA77|nr:AraC family transcriptional regulator [Pseudonocardia sp. N23]